MRIVEPASRYIAIEGIDGAGKTTLCRGLRDYLESNGLVVALLKEPTEGPHAQRARAALLGGASLADHTVNSAFFDDRVWSSSRRVAPLRRLAVQSPELRLVVLQDRCYWTGAAYGSVERSGVEQYIERSRRSLVRPDVILLLDCGVETALQRLRYRRRLPGEIRRKDVMSRASANYELIAELDPCIRIDARQNTHRVLQAAIAALE